MRRWLTFIFCAVGVMVFGDGVDKYLTPHAFELAALDAVYHDCEKLSQQAGIVANIRRLRGVTDIEDMTARERLVLCGDIAKEIRRGHRLPVGVVFRLIQIEKRAARKH